jgi:MFS-type transporter involved in bile tolerance (Atg22 family)
MMGYLRDATHSFAAGLIVIGAFFVMGASLVLTIRPDGRVETEETEKV